VALCEVVFTGTDGRERTEVVDGASLYSAADNAIRNVIRLWWFDSAAVLVVKVI